MFGLSVKGLYVATVITWVSGVLMGAWYPLVSLLVLLGGFLVARFALPSE